MKRVFLITILSTCFVLTVYCQGFVFSIKGKDAEGSKHTLKFGVNIAATFCEDIFLGEHNNYYPPAFPYNFTWANPRTHGPCDGNDCFSCGRLEGPGNPALDLRGYFNTSQIDTYRVSLYSYLMKAASWPFTIEWTPNFSPYCDSMKLEYSGPSAGNVVVNMFQDSSHLISDGAVEEFYIIKWGARLDTSLQYYPNPIDFGEEYVGLNDTVPVTVTNWSGTSIRIDSIYLTESSFHFTAELIGSEISSNSIRTFNVIFSPISPGVHSGAMIIYHSGLSSPDTLNVSGIGETSATPILSFSTNNIMFDTTFIGSYDTVSVTATNLGVTPIIIDTMYSSRSFPFSRDLLDSPIAGGETRAFKIFFAPFVAEGWRNSNLTIKQHDLPSNYTIHLEGYAKLPPHTLSYSLSNINFGNQKIGSIDTIEVTVTNISSSILVLDSMSFFYLGLQGFSVLENIIGDSIASGESKTFDILFFPNALYSYFSSLYIRNSAQPYLDTIPITGIGGLENAYLDIYSDSINFGEVNIGTQKLKSVLLRNQGYQPLTFTSITCSDPIFSIVPYNSSIPPGSLMNLNIIYKPLFHKTTSATIIFTHDGTTSPDTLYLEASGRATVLLKNGWNTISNPVGSSPDSLRNLFPGSLFNYSYSFTHEGNYAQSMILENGTGYLAKFSGTQAVSFSGNPILTDTIDVHEGWNLIGSISDRISTSSIEPITTSIRSPYYEFSSGYKMSDTIMPGRGYWVQASSEGKIVLSSELSLSKIASSENASINVDALSSITLTDRNGNHQTLFFVGKLTDRVSLEYFTLPPAPPDNEFDIRFASGRILQNVQGTTLKKFPILFSGVEYPVNISWNIKETFTNLMLVAGKQEFSMAKNGAMVITSETDVALHTKSQSNVEFTYQLYQNYPNPFNPTTIFSYSIASEELVILKIYNIIGQEVATLTNSVQSAGRHNVQFDASNLPGGIYNYRLITEHYIETKRMILLK